MGQFIRAAGVEVHYVEHGPAGDPAGRRDANVPTAVLLHGFSPDLRLMTGCFEPVFEARPEWRRLYVDLPGMGRTVAPDWVRGTDDVMRIVDAVIAELVPDGSYVVCGESYGGYLARGLAAAHPDRVEGLALVAAMIVAEHADRDVPPHRVIARDDAAMLGVGADDEFLDIAVVQDAETWRRAQEEIVVGSKSADEAALDRIAAGYAGTFELEDAQGPFERPVLFLTGRQDSVVGYQDAWATLEHYPRATFAVLDRAGHNVHIEQSNLFNALVHEWLDRVDEARARGGD
jgi:pimeloyl-ACP methyl ester carboxylesterase